LMESQSKVESQQPLDDWFLQKLSCPVCEPRRPLRLNEEKSLLVCSSGHHGFPIGPGGVPDLLPENAVPLDENANPESQSAAVTDTNGSDV
jgi:uncharacterized protein YbaR (Trm112 family)